MVKLLIYQQLDYLVHVKLLYHVTLILLELWLVFVHPYVRSFDFL